MTVDAPRSSALNPFPGGQAPSRRIVVVEDEPIVALDLVRQLRRAGYEVDPFFSSGEEAVEAVLDNSAQPPALVLMDIGLGPGIDGIEAAHLIKSRADVPVVYVTANTDQQTMAEATETDPFGFVAKPFNERALLVTIEIAMRRHETEQQLAEARATAEAALARKGRLEGILPFCSYCRKIRDRDDRWWTTEVYFLSHTDVKFSHGICPECHDREFGDLGAVGS